MEKKLKGSELWENFESFLDECFIWKRKHDEDLKKQGLHNLGNCLLCGEEHFTEDEVIKNQKIF